MKKQDKESLMQSNTKKKLILIGAGGRGKGYTDLTKELSDDFELVAVAEPIDNRRNYIRETHGIPEELCFTTWEPLLKMPKMADVAVICTMDRDHFAPAMAAIEKGFLTERAITESLLSIKRAGADLIITNFAPYLLLNDVIE